jgi:hypothetical protein
MLENRLAVEFGIDAVVCHFSSGGDPNGVVTVLRTEDPGVYAAVRLHRQVTGHLVWVQRVAVAKAFDGLLLRGGEATFRRERCGVVVEGFPTLADPCLAKGACPGEPVADDDGHDYTPTVTRCR